MSVAGNFCRTDEHWNRCYVTTATQQQLLSHYLHIASSVTEGVDRNCLNDTFVDASLIVEWVPEWRVTSEDADSESATWTNSRSLL